MKKAKLPIEKPDFFDSKFNGEINNSDSLKDLKERISVVLKGNRYSMLSDGGINQAASEIESFIKEKFIEIAFVEWLFSDKGNPCMGVSIKTGANKIDDVHKYWIENIKDK